MKIHDPGRRLERDALLARIVAVLEADRRVCAAWLFGSLGRGDEDDLSDIDVWVIVDDEHAEAVKAARREYVTQIAEPLLIEEAPQNAPPEGAYLCVLYPGQTGPLPVDWYWQPRAIARLLPGCHVLFDRVGIPVETLDVPLSANEHGAAAFEEANFIWVMVNVAAKSIARQKPWLTVGHIASIRAMLDEICWHVGLSSRQFGYVLIKQYTEAPPMLPVNQLEAVRRLAHEMAMLHPHVTALAGHAPDEVISPTLLFLDRVEGLLHDRDN